MSSYRATHSISILQCIRPAMPALVSTLRSHLRRWWIYQRERFPLLAPLAVRLDHEAQRSHQRGAGLLVKDVPTIPFPSEMRSPQ